MTSWQPLAVAAKGVRALMAEVVRNAPYHVFGRHTRCSERFCQGP